MNKIIIGLAAVVLIGGVVYVVSGNQKETMMQKETAQQEAMGGVAGEDNMNKETSVAPETVDTKDMMEKSETMTKAGVYETYSADKVARAETGDVVLFFHASWCPSCRGLSADIESNISAIPAGVSILKADYDKETDLKKKYGVTTQHTLVQVDKDGILIKKWSGCPKLTTLVSQIQ